MKAVIFDLDGTLLDTLEDLYLSVNFALQETGCAQRTREEVRQFVGNGAANLIKRSLGEENESRFDAALAAFRSHYGEHSEDHTCPYPHILPMLEKVKESGYKTAIISNKPDSAVQTLAKKFFSMIPYVQGEKEGIPRKPSPDSIFYCLNELGVEKENCVYVGDSEVDVMTAKNAKIPCIAVTWGFRDKEVLVEAGAEIFADTVEELYERIREWL